MPLALRSSLTVGTNVVNDKVVDGAMGRGGANQENSKAEGGAVEPHGGAPAGIAQRKREAEARCAGLAGRRGAEALARAKREIEIARAREDEQRSLEREPPRKRHWKKTT